MYSTVSHYLDQKKILFFFFFCLGHFELSFLQTHGQNGRRFAEAPAGGTGQRADGTVGAQGPDLDVLLQPLLLTLQLPAALLLLAHAGLQLRHHQLQLLFAGRQPPPGLLGLRAQLRLRPQLLCQAGTLLFQLGVGKEVSG